MGGRFPWDRRIKDQKGQILVEFVLVVPILAILIFGFLIFGLLVNSKQVASGAAREAARRYSITASESEAREVATEYLRGSLPGDDSEINCRLSDTRCTMTIEMIQQDGNDYVKVIVGYKQDTYVGKLVGLPEQVTQTGSAVFRMTAQ